MTNKSNQENFSKVNQVGLRALTKLIVYGDAQKSVFSEAEWLFVDHKTTTPKAVQSKKLLDKIISLDVLLLNSINSRLRKITNPLS